MNILLAEDNQLIQKLYGELFKSWGYVFDLAENGLQAVELAQINNGHYDICLMDIEMPKMNGIEATKIIRKTVTYFPIVAFTSNTSYKEACYEAGMDDFIDKSCTPNYLHARINTLITGVSEYLNNHPTCNTSEEITMNEEHAKELSELAQNDLCKVNLCSLAREDLTVIVHKYVPNKISRDFVDNGNDISIFLDRSPEKPSECHLYKSSYPMLRMFLRYDDFKEKLKVENELLKDCVNMVVKRGVDNIL